MEHNAHPLLFSIFASNSEFILPKILGAHLEGSRLVMIEGHGVANVGLTDLRTQITRVSDVTQKCSCHADTSSRFERRAYL